MPTPKKTATVDTKPTAPTRFQGFSPALTHILKEIFHVADTGRPPKILQVVEYEDHTTMSDFIQPHRNYWTRPSTFDGKSPLPAGPTMKMEHLRQYAEHFHKTTGQMISDSDWLALSESAFLVWTQNHGRNPELEVPPPPAPKPQGNAAQRAVSSGLTDDIIFKKSIRRDASAFPVLKDIRYFLVWHRHFIGQIHAQDLSNVIDPTYVPKTSVEVNLFRLQNDFLYTVFQSTLLTDDTKRIVREHEASRDAQSIYKDISEFIRESPDANILVNELMAFLTTEKLDGRWRGTTKGFITHWEQKMAQYEEITPSTQHHADATKKRMLMNAVQTIPALHSIESADELRVAADPTNTVALNYKRYRALLVAAATRYDDSLLKGAKSRSGAPRTAHHMDFGWGAYNPDPIQLNMHTANYLDHGDDYHVTSHERPDEHASMQAFAARRTPSAPTSNSANRPYIPLNCGRTWHVTQILWPPGAIMTGIKPLRTVTSPSVAVSPSFARMHTSSSLLRTTSTSRQFLRLPMTLRLPAPLSALPSPTRPHNLIRPPETPKGEPQSLFAPRRTNLKLHPTENPSCYPT